MRFFDRFRRHARHLSIRHPEPEQRTGPGRLRLALEPRFLFDAAGLMAGLDIAGAVDPDSHSGPDGHPDPSVADSIMAPSMTPPVPAVGPREIVFIDAGVADAGKLTDHLDQGTLTVVLDSRRDGLAQISQALDGLQGVETIHLVSHGGPGYLQLGATTLDANGIEGAAEMITGWQESLSSEADILVYGCQVASGAGGLAFMERLADLTGADVAASVDLTGAADRGGNWTLEASVGAIESDSLFAERAAAWDGLLAPPDPGGDVAVTDTGDQPVSIAEDSPAPGAANIRLTPATVNDPDGAPPPAEVRILSVTGGTLADAAGGGITLGAAGTKLALAGGSVDLRFTPETDRDTAAVFTYAMVDAVDDGNSAPSTATVSITAVNDAPVLDNSGSMSLTAITEDAAAPAGDTVAAIIASAGGNRITDADSGAAEGIALTGLTGDGAWQYNTGGGWTDVGAVAGTSALLLTDAASLRFVPTAGNNNAQTATVTFRAWDQSDGAEGTKADASATGGTTAFSTATETAALAVTAVNDAPVLDNSGSMSLTAITEDAAAPAGDTVAAIIASAGGNRITDADSGAAEGIALTGLTGDGAWQYNTGGGWTDVGAVAGTSALLLTDAASLRFVPTAGNNQAQTATATFRAWDRSAGSEGTKVDASVNGVTTAFSTAAETASLAVGAVNDGPEWTALPGAQTVAEDTDLVFSSANGNAVSVADVDVAEAPGELKVTLSVAHGVLSLAQTTGLTFAPGGGDGLLDAAMIFTGTTADINAALNGMRYRGGQDYNSAAHGAETLALTVDDQGYTGGGALQDTKTVGITVTAVNDDPAWTVPGAQTVAEDADLVFSAGNGNAITVADPDVAEAPGALAVTLAVSKGALNLSQTTGLTFSSGDGTADKTMTFTGTAAQINAALAGLTYRGDQDYNTATGGAETLVLTVNDQGDTGSGGGGDIVKNVTITVTQVNDDPASTAPGGQTVPEDTELVFSAANGNAITVADLDHEEPGGGQLQVTLSVDHGVLTLSQTAGLTFTDGDGTADPAMTFTGTAADINAALDGLIYLGDANYNTAAGGVEILVLPLTDQGNTGDGGGGVIDQSVGVTVTAVNDDPVWSVPGTQALTEDGGLTFSSGRGNAITVADLDHGEPGGGELQVSLSVSYGVLTLSRTTGLTFSTGDGTADRQMTFNGTAALINAALEGLVYHGDRNANTTAGGSEVLRLTVNDLGHTGAGGGADILAAVGIGVEQVNDDPIWSVPGSQTVAEDTNLVFSSGHGNAITVFDLDHDEPGGGPLQVTLAVSHGTLTLGQSTNLSFVTGDGIADSTMTFTGMAGEINAALEGIVYRGAANYNTNAGGAEALTLTVNDQGHTGSGGGENIVQTVGITVTAVNDDPVWTAPRPQTVAEDTDLVFRAAGGNAITVADPDSGEPGGGPLKVTLAAEHGVLTLGRTAGLTFSAGDGTADAAMTFTGTVAAINTALDGLVYRGEPNYNTPADGAEALTLTVNDQGHTGGGGRDVVQAVGITVSPVNDDPVWSVPGDRTVAEDTDLTFSAADGNAITVADPDCGEPGGGALQVNLAVAHGELTLGRTAGLTFSNGDGAADATMTFTGTEAAINAALDGLVYRGDANYNTAAGGAESLTLTVNDRGNAGSGGGQDIVQTVGITVTAVNDDPVWSVPEAQTAAEDTDLVFSTAGGNAITVADPDSGEPGGGALKVTLAAAHGGLTLGRTAGLAFSDGDGTADAAMTFSGTPAAINAALDGLVYRGDPNYSSPHSGAETLTLTVNDQGNAGTGGGQDIQRSVPIRVVPVADAPELTAEPTASGNQDTAIALTILPPRLVDTDGSEQLGDITIDGVPSGAYLSTGTRNADGSWTVTAAQLPGLTITPPALDPSDFTLTVRLTSTEAATGAAASTSRTIAVEVVDVYQHPSFESSLHSPSSTGRAGWSPDRTDTPFEPGPAAEPAGLPEALSGPAVPTLQNASYGLGPNQEIIRYHAVVMARELGLESAGDPGRSGGFQANDPLVAFTVPADWFDHAPSGTDTDFAAGPPEPIHDRPMVQPGDGFAAQLRRAASDFERHRSAQMAALAELIRAEAAAAPGDGS